MVRVKVASAPSVTAAPAATDTSGRSSSLAVPRTTAWAVLRSMRPSAVHTECAVKQSVGALSNTVTSPAASGVTVSSQALPAGDTSVTAPSEPPVTVSASAIDPAATSRSASSKLSSSVKAVDPSWVSGTSENHAPGGAAPRSGSVSAPALSDTSTELPATPDSTPSVGHQYVPRSASPAGTRLSEPTNCWPSMSRVNSVSSERRSPRYRPPAISASKMTSYDDPSTSNRTGVSEPVCAQRE